MSPGFLCWKMCNVMMVGRGGDFADFCFNTALVQLNVAANISVKYIRVDLPTQNYQYYFYISTSYILITLSSCPFYVVVF